MRLECNAAHPARGKAKMTSLQCLDARVLAAVQQRAGGVHGRVAKRIRHDVGVNSTRLVAGSLLRLVEQRKLARGPNDVYGRARFTLPGVVVSAKAARKLERKERKYLRKQAMMQGLHPEEWVYECPSCRARFARWGMCREHLRECAARGRLPMPKVNDCRLQGGDVGERVPAVGEHVSEHVAPASRWVNEVQSAFEMYSCPACGRATARWGDMQSHLSQSGHLATAMQRTGATKKKKLGKKLRKFCKNEYLRQIPEGGGGRC